MFELDSFVVVFTTNTHGQFALFALSLISEHGCYVVEWRKCRFFANRLKQCVILRMGVGSRNEEINDKRHVEQLYFCFIEAVGPHALNDILSGRTSLGLVLVCGWMRRRLAKIFLMDSSDDRAAVAVHDPTVPARTHECRSAAKRFKRSLRNRDSHFI